MFILSRLPLATLILSAAAIVAWCVPGVAPHLQYDRAALAAGQSWRIITCHMAHFSLNHLAWDLGAFAILGAICERRSRARFLACVILSATAISAAVWYFLPEMQTYRGLSGIGSALFTWLAIDLLRSQSRPGGSAIMVAGVEVALTLFVAKIVVEVATGQMVFVNSAAASMVPVPLAHLAGAAAGFVCAVAVRSQSWRRERRGRDSSGGASITTVQTVRPV